MRNVKRKRRSFSTKYPESSIKYCRLTKENCRSAKIIENELRLINAQQSFQESSASTSSLNNDPANFLGCNCLGSPQQVWQSLCAKEFKRSNMGEFESRPNLLLIMMQLCEYLKYRRETYYRALNILDHVLITFDLKNMKKNDIIFIGIFVVFIASKIEERKKNHWLLILDYIHKVAPRSRLENENLLELEIKIVTNINWSLRTITAFEWAKIYMHMARVYTIYKRICNLSLAHQSTPTKKRTKITLGLSDDAEVDLYTWAQLDNLVIGEPTYPADCYNQIAVAQVLDLCMADRYSLNFTYRQLGAAVCISVMGLGYEIASKITGLKMKDLWQAIDFVNSYRRIYTKHIHKEGLTLARFHDYIDDQLQFLEESDEDEIEVVEVLDKAPEKLTQNVENVTKKTRTQMSQTSASYLKRKSSQQTLETSEITDEVSESARKLKTLPTFTKKSSILVSDTEVSLLEINVNSPNFEKISIEANIPKQCRLRILSPESNSRERISQCMGRSKKERLSSTSSASEANVSSHSALLKKEVPLKECIGQATSVINIAEGKKYIKVVEMECHCGCEKRQIIEDRVEVQKMIKSQSHQKGEGKTVARLFISKINREGTTKICREIAIPHPIETMEQQMKKFYTQSFPLLLKTTKRVTKRLEYFWLAYGRRHPCKRRHSYSGREKRGKNENQQRRKSG